MGGNPRHATWGHRQWSGVAWTVGDIRARGWRVEAKCRTCLQLFRVRLDVVEAMGGPDAVLWGGSGLCPRTACVGRVIFVLYPRGANGGVMMLAVRPPTEADRAAARML